MCPEPVEPAFGRVGQASGEQVVQHRRRRVDVGADVQVVAAGLLRGHVPGRAGDHEPAVPGGEGGLPADDPGQPEIGHLDRATAVEHHVAGFDVAVQQPLVVGGLRRGENGEHGRAGLFHGQPDAAESLRERPAGEVFEYQRADPFRRARGVDGHLFVRVFVHRDDVQVAQPGQGPSFFVEPQPHLRVGGDPVRQVFDGDRPVEPWIPGRVDDAEPAAAEFAAQPVPRQGGHQRPWGHGWTGYGRVDCHEGSS